LFCLIRNEKVEGSIPFSGTNRINNLASDDVRGFVVFGFDVRVGVSRLLAGGLVSVVGLNEALGASLQVTNDWLVGLGKEGFVLTLEAASSVKATERDFIHGMSHRRKVNWWKWERKFHQNVKFGKGWFIALRKNGRPVMLCVGTICKARTYIAIDYLERRPYAHGVGGYALLTAYQFAAALAGVLGVGQVRINDPINKRVENYYAVRLQMNRHPPHGKVQYLYRSLI